MKEELKNAIMSYTSELNSKWGITDGWWVSDDLTGTYLFYDGNAGLTLTELVYAVDNNVSRSDFLEWSDYCFRVGMLGLNSMNLMSWVKGAPRYPEETLKHLEELKNELDNEIEKLKNEERKF